MVFMLSTCFQKIKCKEIQKQEKPLNIEHKI